MFYRAAAALTIAFTFLHLLCLPLAASYDGMEYVHLANVLGTPSFPDSWNFLRTPGFPAALKCAFFWGGEQPQAALLVTSLFGLAGVLLLGSTVRFIAGAYSGAWALLILIFYPVLIGYQHMLLTETGIFFFLALIVWLGVRAGQHPGLTAIALALAIAAGYYWRPTIIYLSPVTALGYAFTIQESMLGKRRRFMLLAATVMFGPWLLALPWLYLSSLHPSDAAEVVTTGMYKQVLVPPADPMFGELGARYQSIVNTETRHGRLPLDGLSIVGEGRHEFLKQLHRVYMRAGLFRLIFRHPNRYMAGVIRSFLYFLGVPHHRVDDENWSFSRFVFLVWPASQNFENVPNWISEYNAQFQPVHYVGGAGLGRLMLWLLRIYVPVVLTASAASLWRCLVALMQRNGIVFTLTGVPLSLLGLHALTLSSAARYAFPAYPLLMANLVALVSLSYQGWSAKRMLDSTPD